MLQLYSKTGAYNLSFLSNNDLRTVEGYFEKVSPLLLSRLELAFNALSPQELDEFVLIDTASKSYALWFVDFVRTSKSSQVASLRDYLELHGYALHADNDGTVRLVPLTYYTSSSVGVLSALRLLFDWR